MILLYKLMVPDIKAYIDKQSEAAIATATEAVTGTVIHDSAIVALGQKDSIDATKTLARKQFLFALLDALITGELRGFPHSSFSLHVLECGGNKGSARRIPMQEIGHAYAYSDSDIPQASNSKPEAFEELKEAPRKEQRIFELSIDLYPQISFEFGVQAEINMMQLANRFRGTTPTLLNTPPIATSKNPIFYKIYSGEGNEIDGLEFDPLTIKEDLTKFIRKIVPFASTFNILELMVTYIQNFTPTNPRPLCTLKAKSPKIIASGHGSFKQNNAGGFYVAPYGSLMAEPILGAELRIDMLKALVLMLPAGKLFSYFLEVLNKTQMAYQSGNSPFYINAHMDLFLSPSVDIGLRYHYDEAEQGMKMSFLDNQKANLQVRFSAKVGGAFNICDFAKSAFELNVDVKFDAHLAFDNNREEIVYYHDGIRTKAIFRAKLYVVIFGVESFKWTYSSSVQYKGDVLKKADSPYRINLVSGKSSTPPVAPTSWYPNYIEHQYQPSAQQWRDVMSGSVLRGM